MKTLTSQESDERTRIMPLGLLCPSANSARQLAELLPSIEQHGLIYPLFCYGPIDAATAARRRWAMARTMQERDQHDLSKALEGPDEECECWMVQVGNQRFAAAYALGYTHVSASLWPSPQTAARCELALKCRANTWRPRLGFLNIDR